MKNLNEHQRKEIIQDIIDLSLYSPEFFKDLEEFIKKYKKPTIQKNFIRIVNKT